MKSKEIKIPKFLHELHGSSSTLFDIIITYAGGVLAIISVYLLYLKSYFSIQLWELILLLLISGDIGAGVVANFTRGTNSYYSGEDKRKLRFCFIILHILHPIIFLYVLNLFSYKSIALVVFVIICTFFIDYIKVKEKQRIIAVFCLVIGFGILLNIGIASELLLWFFTLYMIKLFIGFGVRRY